MARDDFNKQVIDRLAKRVGTKCSCPDCRAPTSGPDGDGGVTNTGVAAHISAASPGGARYDESLTPEMRSHFDNGIWLCQTHAKLVDDDEWTFTAAVLRGWKDTAEKMAALESLGYAIRKAAPFPELERKVPKLVAEMRADLRKHPLFRQFVLLPHRRVTFNTKGRALIYFEEDHDYIRSVMTIMENFGAIRDVTNSGVPKYNFNEEFVTYLIGD